LFYLNNLELRLCIIVLRARFCYKLLNSYLAIKKLLILVNGTIKTTNNFLLSIDYLTQKRREKKKRPTNFKYLKQILKINKGKQRDKYIIPLVNLLYNRDVSKSLPRKMLMGMLKRRNYRYE